MAKNRCKPIPVPPAPVPPPPRPPPCCPCPPGPPGATGPRGGPGPQGEIGVTGPQGRGGQYLYFHLEASDVLPFRSMLPRTPDEPEVIDAASPMSEVPIRTFLTPPGYPGRTLLEAGTWSFSLWGKTSNANSSDQIIVHVWRVDATGVDIAELFSFQTSDLGDRKSVV